MVDMLVLRALELDVQGKGQRQISQTMNTSSVQASVKTTSIPAAEQAPAPKLGTGPRIISGPSSKPPGAQSPVIKRSQSPELMEESIEDW